MMKQVKRFASLLLVLIMALALAVPGLAAEKTGSITIQNANVDMVYTIYRIFELESHSGTNYSYKVLEDWKEFVKEGGAGSSYVKLNGDYVTWTDGKPTDVNAAAFAKAALEYARKKNLDNQGSKEASSETVTFSGLPLGYYLVDSSVGVLCSLGTVTEDSEGSENVVIKEKNELPRVDKEVKENDSYGDRNDASIGETVNFRTTITAQEGAQNYVLHDRLSEGLTYGSVSAVTLNDEAVDKKYYQVITSELEDGCTFHVQFSDDFCNILKNNDKIIVSYTATLNENAVISGAVGNPNETWLDYGDEYSTTQDTTKTYTWDVDVYKCTGSGSSETPLSGAVFTLSKNSGGSDPIALIAKGNNVYRVAKSDETDTVTRITTDSTGKFTIEGLDSGTYYLTETDAPQGYNKLAEPITVVINDAGNTKVNNTTVNEVKVENKSGSELPTTGGMGTTVFYVLGGALMLGAVVLFITKKRMNLSDK